MPGLRLATRVLPVRGRHHHQREPTRSRVELVKHRRAGVHREAQAGGAGGGEAERGGLGAPDLVPPASGVPALRSTDIFSNTPTAKTVCMCSKQFQNDVQ